MNIFVFFNSSVLIAQVSLFTVCYSMFTVCFMIYNDSYINMLIAFL